MPVSYADKPKVVLVNAPFVRHGESGIFQGLENFIHYENLKSIFCSSHSKCVVEGMFPFKTDLRYGVRAGSRWPFTENNINYVYTPFPFIMAYASSYLKANGVNAEMIDCVAERSFFYGQFLARLQAKKPDIVIVETSAASLDIDLWLCGRIASFAEVALAGPHLTDQTAGPLAEEHPEIRYFLKGEYIRSSLEMARTRRPGIYEIDVVKDLDSIPFPDREFPGAQLIDDPWMPNAERPQLQIWGSKGCPFKCKFCLWPRNMYGGHVTLRSPKSIAKEIIQAVARHGYKHIYFDDDTFNMDNDRIAELCGYMKEIGLPWGVMARLDTSPLELFQKMIASGCVAMKFGVESFNPTVLKRIGKGLHSEDFTRTLAVLLKTYPRVKFHLTTMRNLPGQTDEMHAQDLKILKGLGFMDNNPMRSFQLSSCVPFPGTKLYEEMLAKNGEEKLSNLLAFDGNRNSVMQELRMNH